MTNVPCFSFYGDRASGKTWLSTRLESKHVTIIDEFPHTISKDELIKKISDEIDKNTVSEMYIIISYLDDKIVNDDIAVSLKALPGLLVTTCKFKHIYADVV